MLCWQVQTSLWLLLLSQFWVSRMFAGCRGCLHIPSFKGTISVPNFWQFKNLIFGGGLLLQVFLFHPCSIMGTRFALQDDLQLKNTCCDKVMLVGSLRHSKGKRCSCSLPRIVMYKFSFSPFLYKTYYSISFVVVIILIQLYYARLVLNEVRKVSIYSTLHSMIGICTVFSVINSYILCWNKVHTWNRQSSSSSFQVFGVLCKSSTL